MMNTSMDGIIISKAFGSMMADQTFRNIIGYKLLQDENKANDGIGMALLLQDQPVRMVAPKMYVSPYQH